MSTGWDCHAHVFGPYADFPLAGERSYTPPEAPLDAYLALLQRLDLARGVLVHASAYGPDHALLLHALEAAPHLRGVMVVRAEEQRDLSGLRARGVRGLRFSHRSGAGNFAGSAGLDDLVVLAPAMADAGLHAELWTDTAVLPAIDATLRALPVTVVIDHVGGFDVEAGIDAPGFATLRALLDDGHAWIKLCAYRNLLGTEIARGQPFHQALLDTNPAQLLWGSDWPHLRVDPAPDAADLLARFRDWTPDALSRLILVDNPAALYD